LKVKVEADGSFTLVKADDESGGGDGDGDHIGKHQFSVNGVLSSIDDNNVSVSAGDGDSKTVTCAVPDGFDLSGYEVGQRVVITCDKEDGVWTLKGIEHRTQPPPPTPPPSYVQLTGPVTALADGHITVQGEHEPVTCAVPDGADLSGFHVSDYVSMKCVVTD